MSVDRLLEVAVVGATGALGTELVSVLADRDFPVGRLRPIATDRSLGSSLEFAGEDVPVECDLATLDGMDLAFLCAPAAASLEFAGMALRARVPAIDLSGALVEQPDVELQIGEWMQGEEEPARPLVAGPGGASLPLALCLAPLERAAGLRRVVATAFLAASVDGREGVDALSEQTVAVFNQQPLPDEPLAFDCQPAVEPAGEPGPSRFEARVAAELGRILERPLDLALTAARVPTFGGDGLSVWIETERPLGLDEARATLDKAPGVLVWPGQAGPTTRTAVEQDAAMVGRLREEAGGLAFWIAADGLRLAARNAVLLAEARPLARPS